MESSEIEQNVNKIKELLKSEDFSKQSAGLHLAKSLNEAAIYEKLLDGCGVDKNGGLIYDYKKLSCYAICALSSQSNVPTAQFIKEKLGVNDIVSQFSRTLEHLFCVNSKLKVIFSLSPVRHWKDGAIENQWSKSILNVAIHELIRRFEKVSYFPAYELIMDDLRDYRFFKEDLLHPNQMAINYIWEKFQRTYFSEETSSGVQKVEKWKKGMGHRVLGDKTDRMNHLSKLIESAVILENELLIDLSDEREQLTLSKSQLS